MKKGKECLVSDLPDSPSWGSAETRQPQVVAPVCSLSLTPGLFVSFRYNAVLNGCCLRPDLAILPNSDLTEVPSEECGTVAHLASGLDWMERTPGVMESQSPF